jgi:hypothetical protein
MIDGEYLSLENQDQLIFSVYPNPAKNEISINGLSDATIQITDIKGNVVLELANYYAGKILLDSFINGVYFVRATQNEQTAIIKFIVNK